ncbi:MAG: serine/threonine-protein kinase [Acidobacteria bacterium]|nr:serine/threonine-protein kinase [Acidobacteriota bacterium]
MSPERWQQVSRIFRSAISLEDEARKVFVAEQCGEDESLRSAVEKLIDSHHRADEEDFIGGRAAEDGAALLIVENDEPDAPRFTTGQQFGSYIILDRLGIGGMGEVYLARDSRLGRTVALKVLAADVSADKRRMKRFRQEAKVASSLNQPNILTIFEFGEADGLTFLATEYIDGDTLRDYLRGRRAKLTEILDITIQILAALDAAHDARIVHRDIKPENVMVRRRDRVVKVLDFGLAKVTEKRMHGHIDRDSQHETATAAFKTAPGMLMGTINYMSPEQAQARDVDERTDIWSTGVILYEMLTGVMPFTGPTTSHTLVQIIEKEPLPFNKTLTGQVPDELQRIVRKAMAKSLDERYQTAKDMLIDLRHLKRQLEGTVEGSSERDVGTKKKRVLLFAIAAMVVFTIGLFAFSIWRASPAPSTVSTNAPAAPVAVPERVLTYWITVQKFRDGKYQKPFTVAGEINFEARDEIRLNVRSPQNGHLYVLNEGPREGTNTPEFVIFFPSPTANEGSSLLTAGQEVQIPEQTWLRFDAQAGVERLWLVFTEQAVPEFESVKQFANTQTRGLITDAAQSKSIQDFLTSHSNTKPEFEKSDTLTTLKANGRILLYPVRLEHH